MNHARIARLGAADAGELLTLQRAAWVQEAIENDTLAIPPLHESLADVVAQLADDAWTVWGLRDHGRLIATARTTVFADGGGYLGRLGVAPDRQGHGLGSMLLRHAEAGLAHGVPRIELITGASSFGNHAFYARHGYVMAADGAPPGAVRMIKVLTPAV